MVLLSQKWFQHLVSPYCNSWLTFDTSLQCFICIEVLPQISCVRKGLNRASICVVILMPDARSHRGCFPDSILMQSKVDRMAVA